VNGSGKIDTEVAKGTEAGTETGAVIEAWIEVPNEAVIVDRTEAPTVEINAAATMIADGNRVATEPR
jgi:hypothetical protein